MKMNQTTTRNESMDRAKLLIIEAGIEALLEEENINYIVALATPKGDSTIIFKNGMPGTIGASLALQSVKTIAESLGIKTQEMLSDFQRVNLEREEVEELYNEWKKTKNKEHKAELETQICEILHIDDINKVTEGPQEFTHLR